MLFEIGKPRFLYFRQHFDTEQDFLQISRKQALYLYLITAAKQSRQLSSIEKRIRSIYDVILIQNCRESGSLLHHGLHQIKNVKSTCNSHDFVFQTHRFFHIVPQLIVTQHDISQNNDAASLCNDRGRICNVFKQAYQKRSLEFGPIYKENIANQSTIVVSDPEEYKKVVRTEGKFPVRAVMEPWHYYRKKKNLGQGLVNSCVCYTSIAYFVKIYNSSY